MQSTTLIAVDLAKDVFEIAVSRKPGKVVERHRLSRGRFLPCRFSRSASRRSCCSRQRDRPTTGAVSSESSVIIRFFCRRGR